MATAKATTPKPKAEKPEAEAAPDSPLAAALANEESLGEQARTIRGDKPLTPEMLTALMPLLCSPIPAAFIQQVGKVRGKPYDSTGIKSVQVQIDRLNNVLGPANWGYDEVFANDGKLCKVTAWVGTKAEPLVERSSFGGVEMASTLGNLYKGSFTNAAKLAFARLGPGHEVYIGVTDFDPDVHTDLADDAAKKAESAGTAKSAPTPEGDRINDDQLDIIRTTYKGKEIKQEDWKMLLLSHGVERTADLPSSAYKSVLEWLAEKDDKS